MPLADLLIPAIALILGIVTAYLFFRQQISAIEGWVRNHFQMLEARVHKRYPEGFRQPLAFNAEGQDLRADGSAPACQQMYCPSHLAPHLGEKKRSLVNFFV